MFMLPVLLQLKSQCLTSLETHTFGTRWAHHTMPPVFTPSSFCLAMIWFDDILSPGSQKRVQDIRELVNGSAYFKILLFHL